MMFGFGLTGLLFMLILWGGLIFGAHWLIKTLFQGSQQPPTHSSKSDPDPHKILEQRYARGEITREQYEVMKEDLSRL